MKLLTSIFSNRFASLTTGPIFIAIIAVLFLTVSVFNFIAQEKEAKSLRNEIHILASLQEDVNKAMQTTLSYKLNSALHEIENNKATKIYLEREIESIKRQFNRIHSRLNTISKKQFPNGKSVKLVGIEERLQKDHEFGVEVQEHPLPNSLERQNITEHFQKALFYQKNGEPSRALQEYESILRIDPLNAEVHNNMGLLYQQKGEYNKALLAYRKAVSLKPDYNKARSNIGTVLYRQGRLEAAGLEFEFVLEKEPENVHALTNLAIIYKEKGELEKARDSLLKALVFNDEFPQAHYNLALILEELGSINEAIIHYHAFLKYSHAASSSLKTAILKHLEEIEKK